VAPLGPRLEDGDVVKGVGRYLSDEELEIRVKSWIWFWIGRFILPSSAIVVVHAPLQG
jgi:hypothetical protein